MTDRWRTWVRAFIGLGAALSVILAASGAWLWWNYVPNRDQWIRAVHQVSALAMLAVAVVLLVFAILRRAQAHAPGIIAAIGVFVTVGAAFVTGRLLPWDQLALWAVTTSHGIGGVRAVFRDDVKFLVIDGHEVSPSTYQAWAYSHLGLSALVVAALVLVWFRTRRVRSS